jgi:hypothetical protein
MSSQETSSSVSQQLLRLCGMLNVSPRHPELPSIPEERLDFLIEVYSQQPRDLRVDNVCIKEHISPSATIGTVRELWRVTNFKIVHRLHNRLLKKYILALFTQSDAQPFLLPHHV